VTCIFRGLAVANSASSRAMSASKRVRSPRRRQRLQRDSAVRLVAGSG
jgi:hypothetical protein